MTLDLSIIIPAYNEAKRIGPTLQSIDDYLNKHPNVNAEVIVVNDGSSDSTTAIVESLQHSRVRIIEHEVNKGKFAAFTSGVMNAKREWVLLYDADGATPIDMLGQFIPYTVDFDCIIGSRGVSGATIVAAQSSLRVFFGKLGKFLIRLLIRMPFQDTQCGFKLIKSSIALKAVSNMQVKRFAGDIELLYLTQLYGGRIKELGVRWRDVPVSTVKVSDYFQVLVDLIKIHWNKITRTYQ